MPQPALRSPHAGCCHDLRRFAASSFERAVARAPLLHDMKIKTRIGHVSRLRSRTDFWRSCAFSISSARAWARSNPDRRRIAVAAKDRRGVVGAGPASAPAAAGAAAAHAHGYPHTGPQRCGVFLVEDIEARQADVGDASSRKVIS